MIKGLWNALLSGAVALCLCAPTFADTAYAMGESATIQLPPPDRKGGKPLMEALAERKSTRTFNEKPLSEKDLSNLLWAAWGINRPDGRRTAPTALNHQMVEVYVALANGIWRYDGKQHALVKVLDKDTGRGFGGWPVTLIYAAEDNRFGAMHVGSLYQNAGLYCASAGLSNVVNSSGVPVLKNDLPLPVGYSIMIVQSVGYSQ